MDQVFDMENSMNDHPATNGMKPVLPFQIINDADYYPQFENEISNPPPVIPTGFPQLNQILKGGLRPGLYGVGAISSLGKTTYSIQVTDFLAASGRDVLFFTLEMTRKELIAKSISRLTTTLHNEHFQNQGFFPNAATATDILDNRCHDIGDLKTKICADASNLFQKSIAQNRFIIEPPGRCDLSMIESTINAFLENRRSQMEGDGKQFLPPIIAIDYLQVVATSGNKDVRQHIDDVVLSLKIISKQLQTPVFVISSFNRFMYGKQVSYESFKESGGIEYTADCLFGFNPIYLDGNKRIRPGESGYSYNLAKSRTPRIVELVILKNRYGETTGENGIFYEYFAAYNFFRELCDSTAASSDGGALETEEWNPSSEERYKRDRRGRTSNRREYSVTSDGY